jgi:hypothetical protein
MEELKKERKKRTTKIKVQDQNVEFSVQDVQNEEIPVKKERKKRTTKIKILDIQEDQENSIKKERKKRTTKIKVQNIQNQEDLEENQEDDQDISTDDVKKERKKRTTKIKIDETITNDNDNEKRKKKKRKDTTHSIKKDNWLDEKVKLKYDHKGIPKNTILTIIQPPNGETNDQLYIWVEWQNIKIKILQMHIFFVKV